MRKMLKKMSAVLAITMVAGTLFGCAGKKMEVSFPYNAGEYVSVGDYKGLSVEYTEDYAVNDAALQNVIDQILQEYKNYVPVERAAKEGDMVALSFSGKIAGTKIDGFSSNDYQIILGEDDFIIDGFAKQLEGVKAGESKAITGLRVPDPFPTEPSYAGKAITFDINVTSVAEPVLGEYNDELVTKISGGMITTVEEYNKRLIKQLEDNMAAKKEKDKLNNLYDQIVSNTQIIKEFPAEYVQSQIDEMTKTVEIYATLNEMSKEEFVKANYGVDTIEEAVHEQILLEMIFQSIIEKEKLTVTEQYYKDHVAETAKKRNYSSVTKFEENLTKEGVVKCMLLDKAEEIIVKSAVEK